jgi:hypothetical protein
MKPPGPAGKLTGPTGKSRKFVLSLQATYPASAVRPEYTYYPIIIRDWFNQLSIVLSKKGDVCIRMRCWKKDVII